jgi:alpha-1,2-mannosyltransferase
VKLTKNIMVNTRQRINTPASGQHTRREFRRLQQQQQDHSSDRKPIHHAGQVIDDQSIPYVTGREEDVAKSGPQLPSAYAAFKALLTARLLAAFWSCISDCDETYNYWEPMHYLIYGKGFQTWEYDPEYGLRSYAYILLHTVPAWIYANALQPNRMYVFYCVRCMMAMASSACEAYFYIGVSQEIGANVGRITLAIMIFSAGMFVASTALLPSTTSMYLCMLAHGAWFQQSYALAIFATALSTYLSWPFAAILGVPIAWDVLLRKKKYWFFIKWCLISTFTILVPQILLDSDYYGQLTLAPLNIVKYNVLTNHGPDLYGTEPWTYYLFNGLLNYNVAFIAAILVWPLQGLLHCVVTLPQQSPHYLPASLSQLALYQWLSVFWMQGHKEERFLFPVYPLICLAAAVSVDTLQKLWYAVFVKVKVRHYLDHTQWISLAFLAITSLFGMSRITALYQNYHAPLDVWMHINHMSHSEAHFKMGKLFFNQFKLSFFMAFLKISDDNVNICLGKEWHRFPSHFFLPSSSWNVKFIKSEFKGQLPQPYLEDPDGTKVSRPNFNDQNLEEPSRYVKDPRFDCDFLVDFENGIESQLEPIYSKDTNQWAEELSVDFLDAPRSHRLYRALYIPFTRGEGNCQFGKYVLLRNINKARRKPPVQWVDPT